MHRSTVIPMLAGAGLLAARTAPAGRFTGGNGTLVHGEAVVYRLTPDSRLDVVTGKGGLFGFAGHVHRIRASGATGEIVLDSANVRASRVDVRVPVAGLEVLTPPDTAERRKVREAMLTDVLHPALHPEITCDAVVTALDSNRVTLDAALTLEGVTRTIPVTGTVRLTPDSILATASFTVRQTDFGIKPYSGGPLGAVKVADQVTFELNLIAVRE